MDAEEGPFTYPYVEEQRPDDFSWLDRPLLRPAVLAAVLGPLEQSNFTLALVDSGCDHIFVPEWLAMQLGIQLDDHCAASVRLAGAARRVQFADATLVLAHPETELGDPEPTIIHRWSTLVGFMDWSDPPWLIILGQAGFFDEFTVTMSRHAQALTLSHRGDFDRRYMSPLAD